MRKKKTKKKAHPQMKGVQRGLDYRLCCLYIWAGKSQHLCSMATPFSIFTTQRLQGRGFRGFGSILKAYLRVKILIYPWVWEGFGHPDRGRCHSCCRSLPGPSPSSLPLGAWRPGLHPQACATRSCLGSLRFHVCVERIDMHVQP